MELECELCGRTKTGARPSRKGGARRQSAEGEPFWLYDIKHGTSRSGALRDNQSQSQ